MSERMSRRVVMAQVLLVAAPVKLWAYGDRALTIEFGTIAELRVWLDAERLSGPNLPTREYTWPHGDQTCRFVHAHREGWHGWNVYASAEEYIDPAPLDEDTTRGLTALVGGGR